METTSNGGETSDIIEGATKVVGGVIEFAGGATICVVRVVRRATEAVEALYWATHSTVGVVD